MMQETKLKQKERARMTKADRLMKAYRDLGFRNVTSTETDHMRKQGALAPVSFLPMLDYSISSFVGD